MGNVGPTLPSGEQGRGFQGQRCRLRYPLLVLLAALLAGCASLLVAATTAQAADIVVNTTLDEDDGAVPNRCSLREAVIAANTDAPYNGCSRVGAPGADVILFNIADPLPLPSPHRLALTLGDLPPISTPVIVDGWSQGVFLGIADYHGPPLIWIDGGGVFQSISVIGGGIDVDFKGLAITAFAIGIDISTTGSHDIVGSYLGGLPLLALMSGNYVSTGTVVQQTGVCACGMIPTGNSQAGIRVFTDLQEALTVGGTDPGEGNVIVTNGDGIHVALPPLVVTSSEVESSLYGNFIGTDPVGAAGLGNVAAGIVASDINTATIGDGTLAGRNVFGGNGGPAIDLASSDFSGTGVSIRGNYIGVKPDGLTALGNNAGILMAGFAGTTIGGPTEFERNVIAGNTSGPGIGMTDVFGTTISGNYIGVGRDGLTVRPNGSGIELLGAASSLIGGITPGDRNVIAGNANGSGIKLDFAGATAIWGNYVGVLANGSTAAANKIGIESIESPLSDIGGPTPEERNVISGNTQDGIYFEGDCGCGGPPTRVRGNYIGLNANGDAAVPNGDSGIHAVDAFEIIIGGFDPGEGNVISGNLDHGITIVGVLSEDIEIYGNRIGTNAAGTLGIGNGLDGINALPDLADPTLGPEDITIGHDTPGAGNLISGNGRNGIYVAWTFDELPIIHNLIGVNVNGNPLPNAKAGVVTNNAPEVILFENIIANNGRAGILVVPSSGCLCFDPGVLILTNSIYDNQRLGIDVAPGGIVGDWEGDGPTPNDVPDVDIVQNFPVIQSATASAGGTVVTGRLDSVPDTTYRVELFSTPNCDLSNFGEGRAFLGGIDVATNGGGVGTFTMTVPAIPDGHVVTSTASHPAQITSELSACVPVTKIVPVLTIDPATVAEGTGGAAQMSFTVRMTPASGVAVSATWQVVNGTANLSHDIVPVDATGVVTFNPGETTKTIVIRIVSDSLPEPNETFTVKLVSPNIPATEAIGTIVDDDVPAGPCSPRPQISMTTIRTGTNQLVVTVKAGLGTLKKITFASQAEPMTNAQVETIGPASVIQGFGVFTPPPNVTQQSFVVKRILPNLPIMVEFMVEDDCGPWQTLIGNGPNPW